MFLIAHNERITMNINGAIAKSRAQDLLKAIQEAENFFAPFIEDWLIIEQKTKRNFSKDDANRFFAFEDTQLNSSGAITGLYFTSQDWEEFWSYGGHETHEGRTITIPLAFFDDPKPFHEEADKAVKAREDAKKAHQEHNAQVAVAILKEKLAKAEAKLALDTEKTS